MSTTPPVVRAVWPAAVADGVAVLAFTAIGIASHDGNLLHAFGRVVWPFAVAAVLGWLVARAWRDPVRVLPVGVVVWAVTVLGGLALRGLSGGGLAWTFALVTAMFLALTMLGWRALAPLLRRRP